MSTVELTDAIDRVVIVEGEEELVPRLEWIRFADKLECLARIAGEDDAVDLWRGVEEPEHSASARLDQLRGSGGGRISRMRVAKDARREQRAVPLNLGRGIETGSGVVEIHLSQIVESTEFLRPQVVED